MTLAYSLERGPRVALCVLALTGILEACADDVDPRAMGRPDKGASSSDEDDAAVEVDDAEVDAAESKADAGSEDAQAADASTHLDQWFSNESFMEVEVELADADWEKLRGEGRSLSEVLSGCEDKSFEYTTVAGKVIINGHAFEQVGVRKKGFLGSLSVHHPSLRIDLDEFVAGQKLYGSKSLTLNNNQQDPSLIHQCVAYGLFEAAGVPAPRCSLARVTVNGVFLGVYTNVEPLKKPFLVRVFGEAEGDLYEGSAPADFREDLLMNFEKKTHEDEPPGPELERLAEVLLDPPEDLLGALEEVIDLDAYLHFWAMESLVSHWDGYNGNRNNFFVYAAPETRKLTFIPWGTDGAFGNLAFNPQNPASVIVRSLLSGRVWERPDGRERYRAVMQKLLDDVWKEDEILAQIDGFEARTGEDGIAAAFEEMRTFVRGRRVPVQAELDAEPLDLPLSKLPTLSCHEELVSDIRAEFSAPWGDLGQLTVQSGNPVELTLNGQQVLPLLSNAGAGPLTESLRPRGAVQMPLVMFDGSLVVLQWQFGMPEPVLGETLAHGFESFGVVLTGPDAASLKIVGFIGPGKIVFDQVGGEGDTVAGHFEGKFVSSVVTN